MKRKALLLVGAMALALVLAGGVALAQNFVSCPTSPCNGTPDDDFIIGSDNPETINALAGDDEVLAFFGDDIIHGGTGADKNLVGGGDSDTVFGEGGADFIDLAEGDDAGSKDSGIGGPGNDTIDAVDGNEDFVSCGKGTRDKVFFDKGVDTITRNCEIKRAIP